MRQPALIVIAKEPAPGRVKTRLCPPCSAWQAAAIAEAALADTLEAIAESSAPARTLVLDGEPGDWLPEGFAIHPQSGGGLDRRLAAAFETVEGAALLVGMDTPQLDPELLDRSLAALAAPGSQAVLGEAVDGGYWAIGLRRSCPQVFAGVPMSTPWTARAQRSRLSRLEISWTELPALVDVDTFGDALEVAGDCPGSRFAEEVLEVDRLITSLTAGQGAAVG